MTTVLDFTVRPDRLRGRGAVSNASGRYEKTSRVLIDDGWSGQQDIAAAYARTPTTGDDGWDDGWRAEDAAPPPLRTEVIRDATRSIIARNKSPDISFDQ